MKKTLLTALTLISLGLGSQVDLVSNLKVCMPFNGNANDFSGNSNNGTVSSATLTTDRFGQPNKAYAFNGNNNSHIAVSSFSAIAPTMSLLLVCGQNQTKQPQTAFLRLILTTRVIAV